MSSTDRTKNDAIVDLLDLGVDALATYRLTKLIKDDKITEDFRNAVYERFGEPNDHKLSYLVGCPWCLSFYFGLFVASGRVIWPRAWKIAARALALSTITGIMAEREESLKNTF